ncbi:MAG: aminotransferase class IV, partial [Balneolaceae bacterium]
ARFQVSIGGTGSYRLTDEQELLMTASIGKISTAVDNYRIKSVNIPVIPSAVRPPYLKLCNNLHYMKAWREAEKAGAQNALIFTTDGMVSEAATGNIFWKKGDTIFTPDSTCDILPGVMREICCKLITNNNEFLLQKGRYTFDDLTRAESVWITNSVIEIQPVSMIDSITYNTGDSVFEYLYQTLAEYKKLHLSA